MPVHDRRAGRRTTVDRLLDRHRLVDHLEGQLGGLAKNVLEALRILQARHLDQDAVGALPLDDRLGGAEFVDAFADDFDRLGHCRADAVVDAGVGQRVFATGPARAPPATIQRPNSSPNTPDATGCSRSASAVLAFSISAASRMRTWTVCAAAAEAGIADLGVAQLGADLVARGVEALVDDVLPHDLEQDVRSALQVEAERHLLLGQPVRPGGEHVLRDQIGGGEDDASATASQMPIIFQREK